jgi:hypothetical protein
MARPLLVATFADEHALRDAARRLHAHGSTIHDIHTPYPVHGLDGLIGVARSRLPAVSFAAGLAGLALALGFQFYAAVFDWPLNVGGKPPSSTLAFIPIAFEITILCAGLAVVVAFLVRAALFPGARGEVPADGVTEDVFAIVLRLRHPDAADDARVLLGNCAQEISIRRTT